MLRRIFIENSSDKRTLTLKMILDLEKICYSFIDEATQQDFKDGLFLCTSSLIQAKNIVVFNPELSPFPLKEIKKEIKIKIRCKRISAVLNEFGLPDSLVIPAKHYASEEGNSALASLFADDKEGSAISHKNGKTFFLFDILPLFIDLISETYFKKTQERHLLSNSLIEKLYKKLPYLLRIALYRTHYRSLHKKLAQGSGFKTLFPIDPLGFALLELIKEAILLHSDYLKIGHWPSDYRSATLLTHDTEPTVFSYKKGLKLLFDMLQKYNYHSTITLVGDYVKYIDPETRKRFKDFEVGCHDLYHDRKFLLISPRERKMRLQKAKELIEIGMQKKVAFFRAPTLQRPDDLLGLLEETGYLYDSSLIDSQREEPYCGKGNSFYLPFFPLVQGKVSPILELTVTAPDCISPYFFGYSMPSTIRIFQKKVAWIERIGGMGVYIIHTPAWGYKDAQKRFMLLEAMIKSTKNSWNATVSEMANWWTKRSKLLWELDDNVFILKNSSKEEFKDITLEVVSKEGVKKIKVRNLQSGKMYRLPTQSL